MRLQKSNEYSWYEYDLTGLYSNVDCKAEYIGPVLIADSSADHIYIDRARVSDVIGQGLNETWAIRGLPIAIYGSKENISAVYQKIRRHLLGIIACDELKTNPNAIAKMVDC